MLLKVLSQPALAVSVSQSSNSNKNFLVDAHVQADPISQIMLGAYGPGITSISITGSTKFEGAQAISPVVFKDSREFKANYGLMTSIILTRIAATFFSVFPSQEPTNEALASVDGPATPLPGGVSSSVDQAPSLPPMGIPNVGAYSWTTVIPSITVNSDGTVSASFNLCHVPAHKAIEKDTKVNGAAHPEGLVIGATIPSATQVAATEFATPSGITEHDNAGLKTAYVYKGIPLPESQVFIPWHFKGQDPSDPNNALACHPTYWNLGKEIFVHKSTLGDDGKFDAKQVTPPLSRGGSSFWYGEYPDLLSELESQRQAPVTEEDIVPKELESSADYVKIKTSDLSDQELLTILQSVYPFRTLAAIQLGESVLPAFIDTKVVEGKSKMFVQPIGLSAEDASQLGEATLFCLGENGIQVSGETCAIDLNETACQLNGTLRAVSSDENHPSHIEFECEKMFGHPEKLFHPLNDKKFAFNRCAGVGVTDARFKTLYNQALHKFAARLKQDGANARQINVALNAIRLANRAVTEHIATLDVNQPTETQLEKIEGFIKALEKTTFMNRRPSKDIKVNGEPVSPQSLAIKDAVEAYLS